LTKMLTWVSTNLNNPYNTNINQYSAEMTERADYQGKNM